MGIEADFSRLRFFEVPGTGWESYNGKRAVGRWIAPHDVYVAGAHDRSEEVVKHELVHDYLQGGERDDPRFGECSGIGHAS